MTTNSPAWIIDVRSTEATIFQAHAMDDESGGIIAQALATMFGLPPEAYAVDLWGPDGECYGSWLPTPAGLAPLAPLAKAPEAPEAPDTKMDDGNWQHGVVGDEWGMF